jgi:hypothetical protein
MRTMIVVCMILMGSLLEAQVIDPSYGDGKKDATEVIRQRIAKMCEQWEPNAFGGNDSRRKGGALEFTTGIYRITDTIKLPDGMGLKVRGAGCQSRMFPKGLKADGGPWLSKRFNFLGTAILYDGPEDQPMFLCRGQGLILDGISLWGNGKASAGLKLEHDKGTATGHYSIGYLAIDGCTNGIECGKTFEDGNCADISIQHFEVHTCENGLKVNNSQGMNFAFNFYQASHTDTMFNFASGGKLYAALVSPERVDKILVTGRQGSGNGSMVINHIVCDAQQTRFPLILDGRDTVGKLTVKFNHLHFPNALKHKPRNEPIIYHNKGTRVIIDSAEFLPQIPDTVIARNILHQY